MASSSNRSSKGHLYKSALLEGLVEQAAWRDSDGHVTLIELSSKDGQYLVTVTVESKHTTVVYHHERLADARKAFTQLTKRYRPKLRARR
jgi:DUF971 family protein